MQRAAIQALQPEQADQETHALRQAFARKRNLMVDRLAEMNIHCARKPRGTFYAWASIANLPEPLGNADTFFRSALERKVMTVPGRFFDVNPGKRRPANSQYDSWVRFSFGPPEANVRMGLDRLEEMIRSSRA
jgi:aspartate/methionine/tyrosine aminotransferase